MDVKIHESWKKHLSEEFEKPYFKELVEFVKTEYANKKVFPPPSHIFRAFELCPFED
ncbi:MAG: uracil-DNA glycosylase, partial [Candidatus Gracilibacteria bacterium]